MQIQLTLDTDYTTTGNSSGMQIDTLAIAMYGQDYNDVEEYNWDYLSDTEHEAKKYWLDNDAEAYFRASLTKAELLAFADYLAGYDAALAEYRDLFDDVHAGDWDTESVHAEAMKDCADAMEKGLSVAQTDLRRDWLYGDYYGNFDGILPLANKYLDGVSFDYDEKKDIVSIDVSDETLKDMVENGDIENATEAAIKDYIEVTIENRARGNYEKKKREREARAAEAAKTREYKAKAAAEAIERKKATLLDLASKK